MALFRRRRSSDSTAAIAAFWDAWPSLRGPLAEAASSETPVPEEVAERVTALVRAIHPELDWEVGPAPSRPEGIEDLDLSMDVDPGKLLEQLAALDAPGKLETPEHALTLRPGASDDARIQSERWSRSAPTDDTWAFLPVRPADHGRLSGSVRWDDHELDLSHVAVSLRVDQASRRIDVGVYHPDNMFLSEETRRGLAEHVVLLALGEDDVVRWVGQVTTLDESPLDPLSATAIPAAVRQMIDFLGGSNDGWVTLSGTNLRKEKLVFTARHPLTRRDFPAFTLAVHVTVPYTGKDGEGQPDETSAAAMQELDNRVERTLGDNGALFLKSTLSGISERLYYLDPDSGVLPEFEEAFKGWSEGTVKLRSQLDPERMVFGLKLRPHRRFFQG